MVNRIEEGRGEALVIVEESGETGRKLEGPPQSRDASLLSFNLRAKSFSSCFAEPTKGTDY
jgi:hypothetical protein